VFQGAARYGGPPLLVSACHLIAGRHLGDAADPWGRADNMAATGTDEILVHRLA